MYVAVAGVITAVGFAESIFTILLIAPTSIGFVMSELFPAISVTVAEISLPALNFVSVNSNVAVFPLTALVSRTSPP